METGQHKSPQARCEPAQSLCHAFTSRAGLGLRRFETQLMTLPKAPVINCIQKIK